MKLLGTFLGLLFKLLFVAKELVLFLSNGFLFLLFFPFRSFPYPFVDTHYKIHDMLFSYNVTL